MSVSLSSITTVALYWLQRFTRLDLECWEEPWNASLEGKEVKECVERFSNGHRGVSLGLESGTFRLRLEAGTSQPFEEKERFKNGWRWEGQDFCSEVCPVLYCGKGRQAQDWAKSPWSVWVKDRSSCWILLHKSQQEQRHHLGRGYTDGLLEESQEVHSRNKSDVHWD